MKTLYLLRHAKSSSENPGCKDFDRPLSKRGLNDVPVMASRFKERKFSVQLMISSSAKRAQTTASLMAKNIGFPVEDIISNSDLYFAGIEMFLRVVSLLEENCESAMLVGHNPSITDFANCMANKSIDNMPTCGLIKMSLPINYWSDIVLGKGTFVEFDYPKNLR
jgi:phosphohistidine phosphatase